MNEEQQRAKTDRKPEERLPIVKAKLLSMALLVLVSTAAGFFGGWVGGNNRAQNFDPANSSDEARQQIVLSESQVINDIAEEVGQSVVSVNVTQERVSRGFFGFGEAFTQRSAGTGFILSEDGVVVTNRHVVPRGTNEVSVTLSDGTELDNVEVIGRTNESDPLDIAFLKIRDLEGKELKPVKLGDSSKVRVGDKVVAIGNALGRFQNTVTTGIISGYGRNVEAADASGVDYLQNLFQTDTAINQGNSGGPLVNINGEVIGINTAVAGGAENIGFAIPINDAGGLIKSVLETGELLRPYLGVRYISLTDDLAFQYGLDQKRGAFIAPSEETGQPSILPDSPAQKAGLQEGDIITRVNDTPINEDNSLVSVLGRFAVGDTVTLTVVRDGNEMSLQATLEETPGE